jgi:hypothetical protein
MVREGQAEQAQPPNQEPYPAPRGRVAGRSFSIRRSNEESSSRASSARSFWSRSSFSFADGRSGRDKVPPRAIARRSCCSHVRKDETRLAQVDGGRSVIGILQVAFPEVKRDFVKRTLFPLFGLGKPENPTLGIQRGARSAHLLLTAYLHEPVHDPHSCGVKPIHGNRYSRVRSRLSQPTLVNPTACCACESARTAAQHQGTTTTKLSVSDGHNSGIRHRFQSGRARNQCRCARRRGARFLAREQIARPLREAIASQRYGI